METIEILHKVMSSLVHEKLKNREYKRQQIEAKVSVHKICGTIFLEQSEKLLIQTFVLLSESIDDYIEHRITADKTIEGILKDIQGSIADMAEKK